MLNKFFQWSIGIIISFCVLTGSSFSDNLVQKESISLSNPKAGKQFRLLFVGDDIDKETVPKNGFVYNQVLKILTDRLTKRGFEVHDESGLSMGVSHKLIKPKVLDRMIKKWSIDIILFLRIYPSVTKNIYAGIYDLDIMIAVRMKDVKTGRNLGDAQVSSKKRELESMPLGCNRSCILKHVGQEAGKIAHKMSDILSKKLAHN